MNESTFLNEKGVIVTNARFVTPNKTYALNHVNSVFIVRNQPKWIRTILIIWMIVLFITGFFLLSKEMAGPLSSVIIIASIIGLALVVFIKPSYILIITMSSGEVRALTKKDEGFITRVESAINEAIIHQSHDQ